MSVIFQRWLRFRFSICSLLVATLILGCGFAWFGAKHRQAIKQRQAVIALSSLGLFYGYDWNRLEPPQPKLQQLTLQQVKGLVEILPQNPGPIWLRKLIGDEYFQTVVTIGISDDGEITDDDMILFKSFPDLEDLYLPNNPISNNGMVHIGEMRALKTLNINDSRVGDEGIKHLKMLTNLENLQLSETEITGSGFEHLKQLKQLNELRLYKSPFRDIGLSYLAGLPSLRLLDLGYTQVTDAGMVYIPSFPKLEHLSLWGTCISDDSVQFLCKALSLESLELVDTKITDSGIAKLKIAIPNCRICSDSSPYGR